MPTPEDRDDREPGDFREERLPVILDRLFRRMDMREEVYQTRLAVERLTGAQRESNEKLHNLAVTIYGNGVPGLKTNVDRLVIESQNRKWRDRMLIAATVAGTSGVVLLLIETFIKGGKQ